MPEFFSKRFGDNAGILKIIAALIIIVFFIPYTASGFSACGKLFESIFGVPYLTAMIVSGIVIVAYTALGGFLAASTTDFIQSIVMTIALVVVVVFGINYAGGWDNVVVNANSMPGFLELFNTYDASANASTDYSALTIASTLAWGLGYFGMPQVLLRFMAIRKPQELRRSRIIATSWCVISLVAAVMIGIIGRTLLGDNAILTSKTGAENILIVFSTTYLPIIAGLIMAGILAATISSSDSYLLIASSAVSVFSASSSALIRRLHDLVIFIQFKPALR